MESLNDNFKIVTTIAVYYYNIQFTFIHFIQCIKDS